MIPRDKLAHDYICAMLTAGTSLPVEAVVSRALSLADELHNKMGVKTIDLKIPLAKSRSFRPGGTEN